MFNPGFLLADLAFGDFYVPDATSHGFLFNRETFGGRRGYTKTPAEWRGMKYHNATRYFQVTVAMAYGLIPPAKEGLR